MLTMTQRAALAKARAIKKLGKKSNAKETAKALQRALENSNKLNA